MKHGLNTEKPLRLPATALLKFISMVGTDTFLLLANVAGLEFVEMAEAETCCGFGGTFSAKFPAISTAMGEVKCASATETKAEYIVSNDSSCLMHIQGLLSRQGSPLKTIHLAEVLNQK
jgi:L-lactate dehydrogenase complex protein LldE